MFVSNGITTSEVAASVFALCTIVVILFQIALAAGAPWGEFAMGGRFPGKLPSAMRIAALVQVVVLAFITFIVLARAGIAGSEFYELSVKAIWAVVGFSLLATVLNLITPSKRERMIWAPVAILMLVTSVIVALCPASF